MNKIDEIKKRLSEGTRDGSITYEVNYEEDCIIITFPLLANAVSDIELLLKVYEIQSAAMEETCRLLEGLSSGKEIGTDHNTAGEKAKRYAHNIRVEIREAIAQTTKLIEGE